MKRDDKVIPFLQLPFRWKWIVSVAIPVSDLTVRTMNYYL